MSKPVLEIKDFNVDFWVDGVWYPAVIGMNLSLEPGKVTAIVGESGVHAENPGHDLTYQAINALVSPPAMPRM